MQRLFLVLMLLLCASGVAQSQPNKVVVLEIDGVIGPALLDYFERGMAKAEAEGAAAVILQMDTPGGLDTSMRGFIRAILESDVPVVTYVAPSGSRAASAGTYILYASHVAAMAPGTNLGAATPVQVGGMPGAPDDALEEEDGEPASGSAMERKMVEDAVAYLQSLAELRGRNAEWAELAVREGRSLSASSALENNVIDFMPESLEALLQDMDGIEVKVATGTVTLATEGAEVELFEHDWRSTFLSIITDPNVAYVLMLIGIYGLIFELANPGSLIPGIIGAISLVLALFAFHVLPINYAGLALMLLGVALMLAEAFVPSFGALGIGGLISFAVGSVILFDSDVEGFELSMALVAGFSIVSLIVFLGIATMVIRAFGRPVVSGGEGIRGLEGTAAEDFDGRGRVVIRGETWNASSDRAVQKGQRVRVLEREGLRLKVTPVEGERQE
ncbi:serine protease [Alkalilimnicola ehrlichii]|uniref:Serine protease n=1 Tax=Alkalilimnicola ehrlichii TaxID=351052 RepID=A0A3E0WYN4_9GAMM|nr:nodulation protein NfeD [Alkalilimnicola ehrlichii]RFA30556.1 serine protease [Alkalilimnicola ehrlichii]RFA38104.1 serine protease [Alkalilimnicola ehrlichii]